jgi:hypothetical protein
MNAVGGRDDGNLRRHFLGVPQLDLRTAGHEFVF